MLGKLVLAAVKVDGGRQSGLSLLVALFCELGADVGLYVATTPLAVGQDEGRSANRSPTIYRRRVAVVGRERFSDGREEHDVGWAGDVYAAALAHATGMSSRARAVQDYVVWCRWRASAYAARCF